MNVTINSKNVKAGERLAAAIENKMAKLDKYFSQDAEAVVMLSEEKSGLAKLEATIHAGSLSFRAEESNADLFFCLDRVIDKLSSQMSRLKDKLVKRHKDVKEVFISEIPDLPDAVEDQGVVRVKEIELTAMTRDEAILQMELLDHSFFAFADSETGTTNIVYKRNNGGYGLLITK